jgi:hypothetical protein
MDAYLVTACVYVARSACSEASEPPADEDVEVAGELAAVVEVAAVAVAEAAALAVAEAAAVVEVAAVAGAAAVVAAAAVVDAVDGSALDPLLLLPHAVVTIAMTAAAATSVSVGVRRR